MKKNTKQHTHKHIKLQRSTQLPDEHVSASYEKPSSTPPAFCCARRPHRSTDEDSPLRSTQLCSRWTVNVECATSTTPYNDELSAVSFRRQLKTELYIRDVHGNEIPNGTGNPMEIPWE